ncbi:MAG: right-handed parallel beta-helix repeat-containing protein [Bacteroidetes bacterium]|nr:right-handed parallel beta-helix repeat-containing protein [Bacteroidota bacterium]
MRIHTNLYLISTLLSLIFLPAFLQAQTKSVTVSNAQELIAAIGPNTKITLEEGTYNLSTVIDQENKYIEWVDEYDGGAPVISNLSNLTLTGNGKVEIVIESQYSWVMSFKNCSNLSFYNLTVGHTEKGYCLGGCFSFDSGENIEVTNCDLYGSGTEGVHLESVTGFTFLSSRIRECSYYLTQIFNSSDVLFKKSTLEKTEEFNLIGVFGSNDVTFCKCIIQENKTGSDFMPYLFDIDEESFDILLEKSKVLNNQTGMFINDPSRLNLKKNVFSGNSFRDRKD